MKWLWILVLGAVIVGGYFYLSRNATVAENRPTFGTAGAMASSGPGQMVAGSGTSGNVVKFIKRPV